MKLIQDDINSVEQDVHHEIWLSLSAWIRNNASVHHQLGFLSYWQSMDQVYDQFQRAMNDHLNSR